MIDVAEILKERPNTIFACAHKSEKPGEIVCLRELKVIDSILHCPVHGKEVA